jgi:hypothetical protein
MAPFDTFNCKIMRYRTLATPYLDSCVSSLRVIMTVDSICGHDTASSKHHLQHLPRERRPLAAELVGPAAVLDGRARASGHGDVAKPDLRRLPGREGDGPRCGTASRFRFRFHLRLLCVRVCCIYSQRALLRLVDKQASLLTQIRPHMTGAAPSTTPATSSTWARRHSSRRPAASSPATR